MDSAWLKNYMFFFCIDVCVCVLDGGLERCIGARRRASCTTLLALRTPVSKADAVLEADVVRMGDGGVDFPTAWVVHVGGRAAAWD